MLKVHNIETYYGPIRAIHGVSVEVLEGRIVALLGGNGAGKTTILKTICGLLDDQPAKGTIEFLGKRLNGMNPEGIARLGITFVQEGRMIFQELSVEENLIMGGYLRLDRKALELDHTRILEAFPVLKERRDRPAGTLSGGEQQMLVIGRGLMARPRLMLLDEPSLGLAPAIVNQVFRIIQRIREQGTTVLLVEQNARMALQISDYGYLLEAGRIVLSGEAKNLLENENVRKFYLGIAADSSPEESQRYRKKKRWR